MNRLPDRHALLYRCAEMFYIEGRKKKEIADALGFSARRVSRLLRDAEREGVVRVQISLSGDLAKTEEELQKAFRLAFASLVEPSEDYGELKRRLGTSGATICDTIIQRMGFAKVGIGGGSTLLELVEALKIRPRTIDIFPMALVGRGPEVEYVDSIFLATYLYLKSRPVAKAHVVGIPPLPREEEQAVGFGRWLLEHIPEVKRVFEGAEDVDLALVGLGSLLPSRDIVGEYSKVGVTLETLRQSGAVGGINYNYFDGAGSQIGTGPLTVSVDTLRRMSSEPGKTVLLVAGGIHKVEPIRVALLTGMVNSIVTDLDVARRLLE